MNKEIQKLQRDLEKEESFCCLTENSCILKYGIIPIVDNCLKPLYKITFRPIIKIFKYIYKKIIFLFKDCSINCFVIIYS